MNAKKKITFALYKLKYFDFMFNFFRKKEKIKLPYKTDVHCHILPGVDHGAQSIEHAIELIRMQMEMGITRFFLTPHITKSTFENTPETINKAFDVFKEVVDKSGLDVELRVSAEYRLDEYSLNQFHENQFIPLPKEHILIENAYQQERLDIDEIIFDLQLKNLTPIMAHPERFMYYASRKNRYTQMHNAGVLFQVNLLSLAGFFGKTARQNAEWLLEHNYIDMLGSDIHHREHANVISEYIQTKDFKKIMARLEGRLLNDTLWD